MSAEFPNTAVELTQKLIQIPSDKTEADLVRYMASYVTETAPSNFRPIVLPTRKDGGPSLIVANHGLPRLYIVSHIDTVPGWSKEAGQYDPYGGTLENGKIYGRGAADAKHTLAAMLRAISSFRGKEGEVVPTALVFTSDEESNFAGIEAVTQRIDRLMRLNPGYEPAFVFSANGNNGEISYGCRGLFDIDMEIKGRTGHSGIRKPGTKPPISAYDAGDYAYKMLRRTFKALPQTHLGRSTVNAAGGTYGTQNSEGEIRTKYNTVPDTYPASLEVRTNGGNFKDGQLITGQAAVDLMRKWVSNKHATLENATIVQERAAWMANRADGAFLEEIIKEVTGKNQLKEWRYGAHGFDEIAILMNALNQGKENLIPGAIYGKVSSNQFHGVDEFARVNDIKTMEEVITGLISSPDLRERSFSTPA